MNADDPKDPDFDQSKVTSPATAKVNGRHDVHVQVHVSVPSAPRVEDSRDCLVQLVAEARSHLVPSDRSSNDDWTGVDGPLFARIRDEARASARGEHLRAVASIDAARAQRPVWFAVTALAAAAAAAVFLASPHRGARPSVADSLLSGEPSGELSGKSGSLSGGLWPRTVGGVGALARREGAGDVRIGGVVVDSGRQVVGQDSIDTGDVRATFVSARAGDLRTVAATWAMEKETHVDVRHTDSPLVLALGRGAVEAQVTPVSSGEAFAVDVNVVRVAVHGTHLRVARTGDHVVVDLSEGVVSIGLAPRLGSTQGLLVSAPAHVEFDAGFAQTDAALSASVHIDRTPAALRPAVDLSVSNALALLAAGSPASSVRPGDSVASGAPNKENLSSDHDLEPEPDRASLGSNAGNTSSAAGGNGTVAATPSNGTGAASGANGGAVVASGTGSHGVSGSAGAADHVARTHPAADAHPDRVVASAVKQCALSKLSAGDLRVTVSTRLTLRVGSDGAVRFARFDPPLAPDVQDCASQAIYKARFAPVDDGSGASEHDVVVPIDAEQAR